MDGQRKPISLEETRHRLSRALFLLFGIEQRDGNAEWIHGEERTEVLSVFGDRQPANHDVVEGGLVTRKIERKVQLLPMKNTNHSPKPARQSSFTFSHEVKSKLIHRVND